jgi:flagellar biosynthetic protein FliO
MNEPILQAFLSMGLVVLALIAILYFLKKMAKNKNSKIHGSDLHVVSRVSIMPKSHLFVVKAEDKTLLLGATDHQISLIADLTNEEENEFLRALPAAAKERKQQTLKLASQIDGVKRAPAPKASSQEDFARSLSFGAFLKSAFKRA